MKDHSHVESKRRFLASLIGGGVAAPALIMGNLAQAATAPPFEVRLDPKYYPKLNCTGDINIAGKVALITGASRGIGLAVGRALLEKGVQVIGTSRTPNDYPDHPFPLLSLDLADTASIQLFVANVLARPEIQSVGGIDILVNNAGRAVMGSILPVDPNLYFTGIQTALATLYGGHIALTSALLPSLATRSSEGYARILFTTSVAAYADAGENPAVAYGHAYYSSKRALLAYANALRTILDVSGSGIKVSTLNPMWVSSDLGSGTRPIFTQPVDANGNAINDPTFQLVLDTTRALVANGLPTSYAAQAYVELLTTSTPEANVVVGSDVEPYASQGGTADIIDLLNAEMQQSAFPWIAGPSAI